MFYYYVYYDSYKPKYINSSFDRLIVDHFCKLINNN